MAPVAVGRGGALAVGGGAAGGAGFAGGAVGMDVGLGIGRDAESGVRVGAAASVDAAGRFTAVEETDVGFTAAMGRAALGAVAEPAGRAGAAADPTADAAVPALAGVGFVGAAAARGAPLADVGCDGVDFGAAAEADENDCVCPAVAAVGCDVESDVAAAAAVDSDTEGVAGADLRGVVVVLAVGATEVDDDAAAGVVGADAGVDAVEVPDVADETGLGMGASLDASSDGSIIGATHMPEYAESIGAVAHEPVASVSIRAAAGGAASTVGGGDLAGPAREPVLAVSAVTASRAFREPLVLLEASSEVAITPLRTPLGESDAIAAGSLRALADESDAVAAGPLRTPLGESDVVAPRALRTPLVESVDADATGLWAPVAELVTPTVGACRAPLESRLAVPGLFGAASLGVAVARGAVPAALAAGVAELTGVRGAGALAAAGLALWPAEAGGTGGIPNPAGEVVLWASMDESAFGGAAALAGAAGEGVLGAVAVAAGSADPSGGRTSLAAESAPEVAPFPGSSVNSNSSNPSKSSDSGSKGDFAVTAADVPVIPAASASLNASAKRSGSPAPSRLSGLSISSAGSSGLIRRDPALAGPLDDDGAVPTGTLPSMGASTGRSVSGSKMGRDAASIISSLVDTSSNANQSSTERTRPKSLVGSSAPRPFTRCAYLSNAGPAKPRDGSHNGEPKSQTVTPVTLKLRQPERGPERSIRPRSNGGGTLACGCDG